jgi:hypothetical protein
MNLYKYLAYSAGVELLAGACMRLAHGYVEELITGAWGDPLWCGSRLAAVMAAARRAHALRRG